MLPRAVLAALAKPAALTPRPTGHWAYAMPVTEAVYRYHFDRLRWAETHDRSDPALAPRRRVDSAQLALPDFAREHRLVGVVD